MNSKSTSYLLWLAFLFGFGGVHRIYNGKYFSGLLWLFTWGFFGVGQVIDLFLIPDMVESHNLKRLSRYGSADTTLQPAITRVVEPKPTSEQLMIKLLKAAQKRGGKISVTQGVADTGAGFAEVEGTLLDVAKKGYVSIQNDPHSGAVIYVFPEL